LFPSADPFVSGSNTRYHPIPPEIVGIDRIEGIFFGMHSAIIPGPFIRIEEILPVYTSGSTPTFSFSYSTWDYNVVNSVTSDILVVT